MRDELFTATNKELKSFIDSDGDFLIKPKRPLMRLLREGDIGEKCPHCGSSFHKIWWGLKKTNKCIKPNCANYFDGYKNE